MKLKANFFRDWSEMLKGILVSEWGCDISSVSDDEIPYFYFNTEHRRPSKNIYKIVLSDVFLSTEELRVNTKELKDGWGLLKRRVENGHDLTMNLSKKVRNPTKTDAMLNEWGVHHFHLNERVDGSFEKGTEYLVFAWIVGNKFYVIGVFPHSDWVNEEVIEIMHRNWPMELEKYKVQGDITPTVLTKIQRERLREAGVNTMVSTDDGTSYCRIGGGLVGGGLNFQHVRLVDIQRMLLKGLETQVASRLESYRTMFEERGFEGHGYIQASLHIEGSNYIVTFTDYKYSEIYKLK